MTTPQTNADNSDGVTNTPNNTSTASGNPSQVVLTGLTAPFTSWVGTIEADTANFANQVLNSLFYGLAALTGGAMMVWGIYKIFGTSELGSLAGDVAAAGSWLAGPEVGAPVTATVMQKQRDHAHTQAHAEQRRRDAADAKAAKAGP